MITATATRAGLIETLTVQDYIEHPFPYMQPLKPRPIIQSFSGTASSNGIATVGYLGTCVDGTTVALAGGNGWIGVRRDASRCPGTDLYHALLWSAALPFDNDDNALNSIIAFRRK